MVSTWHEEAAAMLQTYKVPVSDIRREKRPDRIRSYSYTTEPLSCPLLQLPYPPLDQAHHRVQPFQNPVIRPFSLTEPRMREIDQTEGEWRWPGFAWYR